MGDGGGLVSFHDCPWLLTSNYVQPCCDKHVATPSAPCTHSHPPPPPCSDLRDPSPAPSDSASLGAQSTRSRADALRRLRQVTHARKRGPEMRGGDGGGGAVAGGGGAVGVGMGGEVQGDPWARYLGSQDQTGEEENAGNRERGAVVGTGGAEGWGDIGGELWGLWGANMRSTCSTTR